MRIVWAVAGCLLAAALAGCGASPGPSAAPSIAPLAATSAPSGPLPMRWVSSYGTEVRVPKAWGFAFAQQPWCVQGGKGRITGPYVEVGTFNEVIEAVGCILKALPKGMSKEFGELPFSSWQPHVSLARAGGATTEPDGRWDYRGWSLTRARIGHTTVTVLASPREPDLGQQVVESARQVDVDMLGCASRAPARLSQMKLPTGRAVPVAGWVGSISVCEYDRTRPGPARLAAASSISGRQARAVARAIRAAPLGGGPDRPRECLTSMHGDAALVLHFVGRGARPGAKDPQAFVYSDSCVDNGIAEAAGKHALTSGDCRPLYAHPPVLLWSAQQVVAPLCMAGA